MPVPRPAALPISLVICLLLLCLAHPVRLGAQELTPVDPPERVLVRPEGGEPLRGELITYDNDGFILRDASDQSHRVAWSSLDADRELWLHTRFLSNDDARAWYQLTARLLKRDDGAEPARSAAARLLRIDPELADKLERLRGGEDVPFDDPPADEATATDQSADQDPPPGSHEHPAGEGASGPVQTGDTEARFWGELSEEIMTQSVDALKAEALEAQKSLGQPLRLYEDQYFLVYSDLDPGEARRWVGLLDNMYDRLMEMFQLPKGKNIFRGKCLIYIFQEPDDYFRYCARVLGFDARQTAGVCESRGDGMAVVAFYRQRNTLNFAHVLVHESVHAFIHRYRSYPLVPSWINEGIAEYVAHALVDNSGYGQSDWAKRSADARTLLRQAGSMRGMLDSWPIQGWQYPVAHELCQFMVSQSPQRYRAFIDAIKDGKEWEQALEQDYGVNRFQLIEAFGDSIRIRNLQP